MWRSQGGTTRHRERKEGRLIAWAVARNRKEWVERNGLERKEKKEKRDGKGKRKNMGRKRKVAQRENAENKEFLNFRN